MGVWGSERVYETRAFVEALAAKLGFLPPALYLRRASPQNYGALGKSW